MFYKVDWTKKRKENEINMILQFYYSWKIIF